MIYTVKQFCKYVSRDVNGFIDEMSQEKSRMMSDTEKTQLAMSYGQVSRMLSMAVTSNPKLGDVHICSRASMLVEYKLPSASAWCDLVMIGKGADERPNVMIVELKNYHKDDVDYPGRCEGLMMHNGVERQHPSDQAKGYTEYCRFFHSAVQDCDAKVSGLVYFTQDTNVNPYIMYPNDTLTQEYPCYNAATSQELANHIADELVDADEEFAVKFVDGYYKQNRNVLLQVAQSLNKHQMARPFVLLDQQRTGFHKVVELLNQRARDQKKQVIIVQGPPGSGKSAVAINLWVEAANKFSEKGSITYVTTSSSQKDNWNIIFRNYGENYNAHRFILTANSFNPGLNGSNLAAIAPYLEEANPDFVSTDSRGKLKANRQAYKGITQFLIDNGYAKHYKDNLHFISVVDEAHSLINPVMEGYCSNKASGWYVGVGPQAYHIIRESQIAVFFMDSKQSFRDNETTSVQDIMKFAGEADAEVEVIDLSGLQFRCAGSKEYVDWLDALLTNHPLRNVNQWKDKFSLQFVDYPSELEDRLLEHAANGSRNVRLVSSYSRKWQSTALNEDHSNVMDSEGNRVIPFDFDLEDKDGKRFQKYWNNPSGYELFVQATKGKMKLDPLCEVGCPYVVRGFDYDYVGLLWLEDIVYRAELGGWVIQSEYALETATGCKKGAALRELEADFKRRKKLRQVTGTFNKNECIIPIDDPKFPACQEFAQTIGQAYRILMSRALKGIYVYIKDDETRQYIQNLLSE